MSLTRMTSTSGSFMLFDAKILSPIGIGDSDAALLAGGRRADGQVESASDLEGRMTHRDSNAI